MGIETDLCGFLHYGMFHINTNWDERDPPESGYVAGENNSNYF